VLYRAAWFLGQDVAEAGVSTAGSAVGYGEVEAGDVAGEEDGDVVDCRGRICGVRWQLQLSVT